MKTIYADEVLNDDNNKPMDIDYHHITKEISSVDYEEKYDIDPNNDDTKKVRN